MSLSNRCKSFLLVGFLAILCQACGSQAGNENKPVSINIESKKEFPFSTKEPEAYQGDFVVGDGETEQKWFVARKGDNWRIDYFAKDQLSWSQVKTDKLYQIEHLKKTYAFAPQSADQSGEPAIVDDITSNFFRGRDYLDFVDLGRDGNVRKYKIRETASSMSEIIISIDEPSGMIVRQEFTSPGTGGTVVKFVYEIRDLKTDVDDNVFQIPAGFRQVTWEEFRSSQQPSKKPV